MFTANATIKNPTGLHARPAAHLVALCKKFSSDLRITDASGNDFDPKSIISVLSAGVKQGSDIQVTASGADEDEAGGQIVSFINGLTE
ncbi:MAG: HPr family phosphocarrier protein [Synergistaceae bacterium]|jgi:phosphotransferase system HPr (HPr) family protein|nr:HPr family phosphocarrier protein [Synergistaceae bacterium]